jgi:hypothetical protein
MSLTTPSNTLNTFPQETGIIRPILHDLFEIDEFSDSEKTGVRFLQIRSAEANQSASDFVG